MGAKKQADLASKKSNTQDKRNKKSGPTDKQDGPETEKISSKNLVEELRIFQNSSLLNQQDPLEQLNVQLNKIIESDLDDKSKNSINNTSSHHTKESKHKTRAYANQPVSSKTGRSSNFLNSTAIEDEKHDTNISTVRKGILWQLQNRKIFSRWTKRFFVLTTDYLVCFKKSSSKVGCSEMGRFLYKIPLGDISQVEWLKHKKSDKGAIVARIDGQFDLCLWTKYSLDEWMLTLQTAVRHCRSRRTNNAFLPSASNDCQMTIDTDAYDKIYENHESEVLSAQQRAPALDQSTSRLAVADHQAGMQHFDAHHQPEEEVLQPDEYHTSSDGGADKLKHSENDLRHCSDTSNSTNNKQRPEKVGESSANDSLQRTALAGIQLESRQQTSESVKHNFDAANEGNNLRADNGGGGDHHNLSPSSPGSMINGRQSPENMKAFNRRTRHQQSLKKQQRDQSNEASNKSTPGYDRLTAQAQRRSSRDKLAMQSSDKRNSQIKTDGCGPGELRERMETAMCVNDRPSNGQIRAETGVTKGERRPGRVSDRLQEGCNASQLSILTPVKSSEELRRRDSIDANQSKVKLLDKANGFAENGKQQEEQMHQRDLIRSSIEPESLRTATSMIRRDDSWQSLVSLTQVGAAQADQRSRYVRHMMCSSHHDSSGPSLPPRNQIARSYEIESTVTPVRYGAHPFGRNQSHEFRPLPKIGERLPPPPSSPFARDMATPSDVQTANIPARLQQQQSPRPASYQQKLLQLQLLHERNSADHYRGHHGGDDQQIYGPDSTAHYGYYSMRSNLKSAASEFSFIRPSPSNLQSTLPHGNSSFALMNRCSDGAFASDANNNCVQEKRDNLGFLDHNSSRSNELDKRNERGQIVLGAEESHHFLIKPETGERLMSCNDAHDHVIGNTSAKITLAELIGAPMKELPLQPNKRRVNNPSHESAARNTSLTSTIASFFRRAFSRRSRRRHRESQLAQSCSSSLGAFDDGHFPRLNVPSAFSTGSKSVNGTPGQSAPPQRMVDMIEAFTSKTAAASAINHDSQNSALTARGGSLHGLAQYQSSPKPPLRNMMNPQNVARNQFGSPLHKSNSICTTMSLQGKSNMWRETGQAESCKSSGMYDNSNGRYMSGAGESPMMNRSAKVMSVNLTPLFSKKDTLNSTLIDENQQFMSPRVSRGKQHNLPRPSSIYGQPSMIQTSTIVNSPLIDRHERNNPHRNSLNASASFRDRNYNPNFVDPRRHHLARAPFLDTTREVAEELVSPTADNSKTCEINHTNGRDSLGCNVRLEFVPKLQDQRQAVVSPMFQSATMDAIYDNHPTPNGRAYIQSDVGQLQSHYDNHRNLIDKNQAEATRAMGRTEIFPRAITMSSDQFAHLNRADSFSTNSSFMQRRQQDHRELSHRQIDSNARNGSFSPAWSVSDRETVNDMMLTNCKPAAIVAPTTPDHHTRDASPRNILDHHHNSIDRRIPSNKHPLNSLSSSIINRSPSLANKITSHYQRSGCILQQSPLVGRQALVSQRPDGTQATRIGASEKYLSHDIECDSLNRRQAVVNIAGAPGINLDPSLAAQLLRGTNIDAYETPGPINSINMSSASKTFLVSTRLSKTMATNNHYDSNSNSTSSHDQAECNSRSTRKGSASSQSTGSNADVRASRRSSVDNSKVDRLSHEDEVSASDTQSSKESRSKSQSRSSSQMKSSSSNKSSRHSVRRGSSTEQSDEIASRASSMSENEDKNWINSKFAQ